MPRPSGCRKITIGLCVNNKWKVEGVIFLNNCTYSKDTQIDIYGTNKRERWFKFNPGQVFWMSEFSQWEHSISSREEISEMCLRTQPSVCNIEKLLLDVQGNVQFNWLYTVYTISGICYPDVTRWKVKPKWRQ